MRREFCPEQRHATLFCSRGVADLDAAVERVRATAEQSAAYEQSWWGKRLACARITLKDTDPTQVAELLTDAWTCQAPRRAAPPHFHFIHDSRLS